MSDIEDRLRAELWVQAQRTQPQQLRELRIPPRRDPRAGPGRRLVRSRRWLVPAAAAMAIAAVAGVLTGLRIVASPLPVPAAAPGGRPPFYVALPPPGYPGRPAATIHASASGAVLGRVAVAGLTLSSVTAAADGRTFVLTAYHRKPDGAIRPYSVTSFYLLSLAADGRLASLRRLRLTVPAGKLGYQVTSTALSGDGGTLAVSITASGFTGVDRLEAVSLRTGRTRTWTAPWPTFLQGLSWGRGATFGFLTAVPARPGQVPALQLHLLDTSRPAGDLMRSSTLVPLSGGPMTSAILTDHGRDVVAWTRGPGTARAIGNAILSRFSAQTGRALQLLYTVPTNGQFAGSGTVWSADPSGQHLLIGITTPTRKGPQPGPFILGHAVLGRLDHGQLTRLPVIQPKLPPQPAAW
jgi:hypothetical protein